MTYDELLKQQQKEREKFDLDRFHDQATIMERQAASPNPASFETVKQQMFNMYKAKDAELTKRQEQERNKFLRVKEPTSAREPDQKKPEKDMTDEAADMLERYRKRQQERKQRGIEPEL